MDELGFLIEEARPSAITKERLREAVQTLEKYRSGKARFERRLIENDKWWRLQHWDVIPEEGTTTLKTKSAWLVNVILSKHADMMDAYPEPSFLPREPADEAEAKMLSSVVPVLLQQAEFEQTWSENNWKKLKSGTAIYGVYWDKDALGGLGNIAIKAVDPLELYWEPGITDIQKSRNVFHVELFDNETLVEQYPQLEGKLTTNALPVAHYIHDEHIDTSEKSAVVDWYYKIRRGGKDVLHYCKFCGEEVLYATEDDVGAAELPTSTSAMAPENDVLGSTATMADAGAWYSGDLRDGKPVPYVLSGDQPRYGEPAEIGGTGNPSPTGGLSERGLYDHGMYPFFFDVLFPEEGTIVGYGYIDICKDAQRQIDLMNNAIVANAVASATPRWFTRTDDGINEAEFADWTKPFVHKEGSLDESSIKQIVVSPLSGNYLNILESKIEELKETSGNRDVNNGGAPSGVTAASAIAAMQEQSGKLSRDQNLASYRVFRKVCYCVIDLVRQFFDTARKFRIVGESGMAEYVQFSNQGLQHEPVTTEFGVPGGGRVPVFDIEVAAAKQSSYSKLSYNELAIQFFQLGFFSPELADQALAAMDMMDFKGKEKVRARISQNGGMYQQMMMMQQQMQQLMAMLGAGGQGANGPGNPAPTGAARPPQGAPTQIREAGNLGEVKEKNTIVEKAKARANEATQPG